MRWPIRHLCPAVVAILFLTPAGARLASAASPFPDKNLEAAIREVLKHEPKNFELTDEKLLNVYILHAEGKGIKDLTGLERCKNLAEIRLTKNQISDIKPLKDLINIQSLDLANNAIKDIGPLANLKGLQYIELSGNQIEKLDALSGLTNLTALYLGGNAIKDLAPLAPLAKLASLSLPRNQIHDIKTLEKVNKIWNLDLSENQLEDVSPLAKQTELKLLVMERNRIKDLQPLVAAAKADSAGPKRFAPYLRLYLDGNPVAEAAKLAQPDSSKKGEKTGSAAILAREAKSQFDALKAAEVRIESRSEPAPKPPKEG